MTSEAVLHCSHVREASRQAIRSLHAIMEAEVEAAVEHCTISPETLQRALSDEVEELPTTATSLEVCPQSIIRIRWLYTWP